jgi:hypothetical protein
MGGSTAHFAFLIVLFVGRRILPGRTWISGYEIINHDNKGG